MTGRFKRKSKYIKINILVPDNLITPHRRVDQGTCLIKIKRKKQIKCNANFQEAHNPVDFFNPHKNLMN